MTAANPDRVHDLLIVGAGPAGLALALALKDAGLDIVLAEARSREAVTRDPRDLALAHGTRLTLERLGVWAALPTTAIQHIHISHRGGLGRTLIEAVEHDLPALGYVASAGALAAILRDEVAAVEPHRPQQFCPPVEAKSTVFAHKTRIISAVVCGKNLLGWGWRGSFGFFVRRKKERRNKARSANNSCRG